MTIVALNTCKLCGKSGKCFHTDDEWREWRSHLSNADRDKSYGSFAYQARKQVKANDNVLRHKVLVYYEAGLQIDKIASALGISKAKVSAWTAEIQNARQQDIKHRVRQLLEAGEYSGKTISTMCGCSEAYVSRIKNGSR